MLIFVVYEQMLINRLQSRSVFLRSDNPTSTPGDGGYENQLSVIDERAVPVSEVNPSRAVAPDTKSRSPYRDGPHYSSTRGPLRRLDRPLQSLPEGGTLSLATAAQPASQDRLGREPIRSNIQTPWTFSAAAARE